MTVKLTSPHPFAERILLFGGGGVGKTNCVLNIAEHLAVGEMYVVEQDYSLAYQRALATDFTASADRVHVFESDPDWLSFITNVEKATVEADPAQDWLVIDPVSSSYDWVQEWTLEQTYGGDLARELMALRKQFGNDTKGYGAAR